MLKKSLLGAMLLLTSAAYAKTSNVWVTMDAKEFREFQLFRAESASIMETKFLSLSHGAFSFQTKEENLLELNHFFHEKKNRCGGFFTSNSHPRSHRVSKIDTFVDYSITKSDVITPLIAQMDSGRIMGTIERMSALHNRYYKSKTGVSASELVYNTWKGLTAHRNDITIAYHTHPSWPQKSVILTWKGTTNPQDKVILGGHLDSISGFFMPDYTRAPGADDNASGIATLTEVLKTLSSSNYAPKNTLVFMAYAAEEVGLRGSQEIAQSYVNAKERVLGVVQFDMTNFSNGPQEISLMSDYTNAQQNQFIGQLIDTYVKVRWGYSKCGYACSDHASWYNAGFNKTSMPFEAVMESMNPSIHTQEDTLSAMGNSTEHALKFAQLGLAFAVEMGK